MATVALPAPALPEIPAVPEPGEGVTRLQGMTASTFRDGASQVRIESRVIIRIPRADSARRAMSIAPQAAPPQAKAPPVIKWKEKKFGDCLFIERLAGMRVTAPQSIDMVTIDQKHFRAHLEEGCSSREFYSGLYVERATDGKLCANRDLLHSRSGSKCTIDRIRLLVPEED